MRPTPGHRYVDWTAVAAEGVMADVIQQHGLVRYPVECACGENFVGPTIGAATSLRRSTRPWRRLASRASAEPPSDERRRRPARSRGHIVHSFRQPPEVERETTRIVEST